MHAMTRYFLVMPLFLVSVAVSSYDLPKRSLDEQVRSADFVSVGVVTNLSDRDSRDPSAYGIAKIRIIKTLKGEPEATIEVVYRNGIAEQDLDCCIIGRTYFLILKRTHNGLYESVNGRYGVLDIDPSESTMTRSTSWPGNPATKPGP